MFDKNGKILPQEVVVPVFDNEVNKQILEKYVADEKAKAPNDELYGKVVDAMVERGTLTEEQVAEAMGTRYSLSDEETAYSNVRYSIQETDPVTYDDNGNVIPLSERFNPEKEDIRYSISQEDIDVALENFTLTKDNVNDFCYALMQMVTGRAYFDYGIVGDMEIRIKDHTPDWDNFLDWDTDEAKYPKILNVTVGDYNNTDYRRNKRDYEEFVEKHPETTAVNVEIEDGAHLEDAVAKIHTALKENGIDFEAMPSYEWVEAYSEEKNDLSNFKYYRKLSLQSEEDILFEKKTAFLTGLVRDYNIPLPTFFAQTTGEFVRMVQDYLYLTDDEVEANREEIERMEGTYVPDDEIILINGGTIRGKEQMSGCVRHEFGHDITKKHLLGEIQQTVKVLGEDAIKRAHQEFLRGYDYKKIGPEGVVNEIVSYLAETPTIQEINAIFEGRLEVDDFISKLQGLIEKRDDLKEKEVYIAALPLAKKNIELQKQQYGAEKENIIVIPRADSSGRGNSISKGGSTPTYSKGVSGTQARSAAHVRRGEGTDAQEVTRYSISKPSYTDRMVDISDVMTVAERKAMLLENAKNMALEGVDAQTIVDETG